MESEIKFYARLLPELASVGARMPTTHAFLWGDYKNQGKEILLLENLTNKGFKHPPEFDFEKGSTLIGGLQFLSNVAEQGKNLTIFQTRVSDTILEPNPDSGIVLRCW